MDVLRRSDDEEQLVTHLALAAVAGLHRKPAVFAGLKIQGYDSFPIASRLLCRNV